MAESEAAREENRLESFSKFWFQMSLLSDFADEETIYVDFQLNKKELLDSQKLTIPKLFISQ